MSINKRLFNNVFWLVVSEVSSKLIILSGTVYLARILGNTGFGLYSLSLAVGVYFWAVADLGITGYGTREIAQKKENAVELYRVLNSLRFVLSICLFLIISGTLYLLEMPLEKKLILLSGSFYIVAYSLSTDWVFRGMEKMQYILFGQLTTALFFIGAIYLFVKTETDALLASAIYSFSFLIGTLVFMVLLRFKLRISFSFTVSLPNWWHHAKRSFYFAINGFLSNVSIFIPIYVMGFISTDEALGIFSAPHRIVMMIVRMSGLVLLGFYPTLSNLYLHNIDDFRKTHVRLMKLIIGIAIPSCIIIALLGEHIIMTLFGTAYTESIDVFNVMIWFSLLAIVTRSISISLLSAGFQQFNVLTNGVGAVIAVIVCIVLIPHYSSYGGALALICGESVILVMISILMKQKIGHSEKLTSFIVKVLIASTVMALLILSLPLSKAVSIPIGILGYALLACAIGIVNRKTIQLICRNLSENRSLS